MAVRRGVVVEVVFGPKNCGEALCWNISKKDGHRHRNVFKWYVDILMYSKNRKLFNIHMTAFLVL